MNEFLPYIIGGGVFILSLTISGLFLARRVAVAWAKRGMSAGEREQFERLSKLLESEALVEWLAPAADFQVELEEGQRKRAPLYWLSPWPRALKLAWKRHRRDSARAFTLVTKQVRSAAEQIIIETLPDEEQPFNAGSEHFSLTLPLRGEPENRVLSLAGSVKSQLSLAELKIGDALDFSSVRFIGHGVAPVDRLENTSVGVSWLKKHPAELRNGNELTLPLALDANGEVWSLNFHHTLVYGLTGAGKGSVIQSFIFQVAPFVGKGLVRLRAIDPKNTELRPYENSNLFETYGFENSDIERVINDTYRDMRERARTNEIDLETGELNRNLSISQERPMVVLIIDELNSVLNDLSQTREGRATQNNLTNILNQGRSLGFYVFAAGQNMRQELLGAMRDNFVRRIALRAVNSYWSDTFVGEGMAARGFDASQILPHGSHNTAGIAYAVNGDGEPRKVRFAYMSDRAIADLILSEKRREATPLPQASTESFTPEATGLTRLEKPVVTVGLVAPALPELRPAPTPSVSSPTDIRDMPTAKLERLYERVAAKLAEREDPKGRHFLNDVEAELRIRRQLEALPKLDVVDDDDDGVIQLPELKF